MESTRTCTLEGCDRPMHAKGYCKRHYQQQWATGSPDIVRPNPHCTPEERFWAKVPHRPEGECWEWTGHRDKDGYGSLRRGSTQVRAHRFSYELHHGPTDFIVRHAVCDNPSCVNPAHLAEGTHQDNMDDRRGAGNYAPKTHCKWGHAFTGDNVAIYSGTRYCRTCIRRRAREQRERRALIRD